MTAEASRSLWDEVLPPLEILPSGAVGIDAGLTLTKTAVAAAAGIRLVARTSDGRSRAAAGAVVGMTGARAAHDSAAVHVPEIDAAVRGVQALITDAPDAFVLALVGTGTSFALVREARITHLGGTALGGGSFAGIARRMYPTLSYDALIAAAERGDRRRADTMISDAYPEGLGRIGPELTAAHLAKPDGDTDDVLAALLNLHGENIGQIAASRALVAQARTVVLAGGFVHNNEALLGSLREMIGRFGVQTMVTPSPGFAGAIGAAIAAAEQAGQTQGVEA